MTISPTGKRAPDEETLREIVRRIVDVAQPERIILFGSAARGEMGPNSDVDRLVVRTGERRSLDVAGDISQNLGGIEEAVDVVVATPQELERYGNCFALVYYAALREGRVLYESS